MKKPKYSNYKDLDLHRTSEFSKFLSNEIKFEIYSKLPRLEQDELKTIDSIKNLMKLKNKTEEDNNINNENLKTFFVTLKKKYTNFLELQSINDDLLMELYDYVLSYDENKFSAKNRYFSYSLFIKKMIEKTVNDDFDDFIDKKFEHIGSNVLTNFDGFWLNALFDSKFTNSQEVNVNDLIKYNSDMSSTSIIITIELYYNMLENDIYTLLINRPETKRIVLKIEQRSYWVNKNIQPMIFTDEEWDTDMNRVIEVFLSCILEMSDVKCLSILSDKDCNFTLNSQNCTSLAKIFEKQKSSLEIFTICRVVIEDPNIILDKIFSIKTLKLLLFKGAKFSENVFKKAKEYYNDKNTFALFKESMIYIRFSKKCLFTFTNKGC